MTRSILGPLYILSWVWEKHIICPFPKQNLLTFWHYGIHSSVLADLILHVLKNWHKVSYFLFRLFLGNLGSLFWIVLLSIFPQCGCSICLFLLTQIDQIVILLEGNYLINYLASKGPELEPFVLGSLIQLFCRITKFGWLDDDKFTEVVKEAMNFLSQVTCYVFIMQLQLSEYAICTSHNYFVLVHSIFLKFE